MAQYVITDGSRFIYRNHSGRFVPTTSEVMADKFSKKQADGILNNSLPKALKSVFYCERYDVPPENIKEVTYDDLDNNTEKVMLSENIQRWLDRIADLNGLIKEANSRKCELDRQLHTLEDEQQDIMHYIEFTKLNAAQRCRAIEDFKDCRMRRRSVKNELVVINIILQQKMSEEIGDEILKRVQGMDNRTYSPRVRKELFCLEKKK